jgi:GNAT superfamily N-acetyltransferase
MHNAPTAKSADLGEVAIAELSDGDWQILREMRLASLEESPKAFWASLPAEAAHSQDEWTGFLRAAVWLVASSGTDRVGIVGILNRPESPNESEVIGMWIAPQARRRRVADNLLSACDRWARSRQLRALTLWIVEDNHSAKELYTRHGYVLTGETMRLPRDQTQRELRMRLTL